MESGAPRVSHERLRCRAAKARGPHPDTELEDVPYPSERSALPSWRSAPGPIIRQGLQDLQGDRMRSSLMLHLSPTLLTPKTARMLEGQCLTNKSFLFDGLGNVPKKGNDLPKGTQ